MPTMMMGSCELPSAEESVPPTFVHEDYYHPRLVQSRENSKQNDNTSFVSKTNLAINMSVEGSAMDNKCSNMEMFRGTIECKNWQREVQCPKEQLHEVPDIFLLTAVCFLQLAFTFLH